jgi:glycosyltransferase involved in cell wall biosynthesis
MKILIVNTRHFHGGGDSTHSFNLSALLRQKGHQVAFFAMQDPRNLPDPNHDLFVSHIDFHHLNNGKSLGTSLKVASRVIYSLEAHRKFRRLLDRFPADVIHLQNIYHHITPAVIQVARQRSIPVVWTLHDYTMVCPNSYLFNDATEEICEACGPLRYYPAVLNRCKKGGVLPSTLAALETYVHKAFHLLDYVSFFLAPSRFLKAKFLQGGVSAQRLVHLPYFIPDDHFRLNGRDQGYLLFLGKLDRVKGIFPLLKAAHLSRVPLVLAGRADEDLKRQLPEFLPATTQYVGFQNREAVKHLLAGARALVLPSIWYENQPFVILEAFAAGKPVIASDLGGMTELLEGGERGLLAAPGDAESLAAAMELIYSRPEKALAMGQRAQEYARRVFGSEAHYEATRRIYAMCIDTPD